MSQQSHLDKRLAFHEESLAATRSAYELVRTPVRSREDAITFLELARGLHKLAIGEQGFRADSSDKQADVEWETAVVDRYNEVINMLREG